MFLVKYFLILSFVVFHSKADELIQMSGSGDIGSGFGDGSGSGEEEAFGSGMDSVDSGSGSGSGEEEDNKPQCKSVYLYCLNKILLVFDPEARSQFPHMQISLEQFLNMNLEESEIYENLTELLAEFQLFQHGGLELDGLKETYGDALSNLLKTAPNLNILHPVGGHFYFPENGVSVFCIQYNSTTFRQWNKLNPS
jgi:hypothetical protein